MYDEIAQAKADIHALRQKVNSTWEKWLPLVRPDDKLQTGIEEMFDDASDKVTDYLERLIDLIGDTDEAERKKSAAAIVTEAESTAAAVLQRVVSWHLTEVQAEIYKWRFRWFFVIEDISKDLQKLNEGFKEATAAHEQNRFARAVVLYFTIADEAIDLRSRVQMRPRVSPQRRQIIIAIVALAVGTLALVVGIVNIWLRLMQK
jgi:hypothetical protein